MSRLVYLVGEGPGDIGGLAREPAFQNADPGFVQPIVRRLLRGRSEFVGRKLSIFGKKPIKGLSEAISRKAYLAAMFAFEQDADVLVFVTDVDKGAGSNTKKQAEKMMAKLQSAIGDGFSRAAADGSTVVPVAGTPCRTIEAWVLGDLQAVRKVCKLGRGKSMTRPPEELWGAAHDPTSGHPKSVLRQLVGEDPDAGTLAAIGEQARLKTMRECCPASFEPFAARLEAVGPPI